MIKVEPVGGKPYTLARANAALKKAGYAEQLVHGRGYYYFMGGQAHTWYSSSIPTYSIAHYTDQKIVEERNYLANSWRN